MVLQERISKLLVRQDELARQRRNTDILIQGLESEIKVMVSDKAELDETWNTLRELLDRFSAESIGMLRELLNKGVSAIFTDRIYTVNIDIADTQNKKMKISVIEQTENGPVEVEFGGGALLLNGGGLLVVISFILQVFLINMYGKRKFIVIDEGFAQISSAYVEAFFRFLKYLHSEMGFDFLMVNHDPRFAPYMDKTYNANGGKFRLT